MDELINDQPVNFVCKLCLQSLTHQVCNDLKRLSVHSTVRKHNEGKEADPNADTGSLSEDQLSRITAIATRVATESATKAALEFIKECIDRREKKNNVVIIGLPDKYSDDMRQRDADTEKIGHYCDRIGIPRPQGPCGFYISRRPCSRITDLESVF